MAKIEVFDLYADNTGSSLIGYFYHFSVAYINEQRQHSNNEHFLSKTDVIERTRNIEIKLSPSAKAGRA